MRVTRLSVDDERASLLRLTRLNNGPLGISGVVPDALRLPHQNETLTVVLVRLSTRAGVLTGFNRDEQLGNELPMTFTSFSDMSISTNISPDRLPSTLRMISTCRKVFINDRCTQHRPTILDVRSNKRIALPSQYLTRPYGHRSRCVL